MIVKIEQEQNFKENDLILFKTGNKSVNTYPSKLRVGIVITNPNEDFSVKDIETGKIWRPYTNDCYKFNDGLNIKFVKPVFEIGSYSDINGYNV